MMPTPARSFRSTADQVVFYSIFGIFVGAPLLGIAYAASKAKIQWGGSIAFLLCSLSFFYFCVIFFLDTSELVFDDAGLARRIFGRVCMQIPWDGIKVIREQFFVNHRFGGQIFIEVNPKKVHGVALRFRRTIKFSEQIERFDELVELLNAKVKKYSIQVEIASKGMWNSQPKLVATVNPQGNSSTL